MDIYLEEILDRYRNPRNSGKIENAQIVAKDSNPLCGDEIEIYLKLEGSKIAEAKFLGKGCAISQSFADILMENLIGKEIEEVKDLKKEYMWEITGIDLSNNPTRVKCGLLSFKVLKLGIYSYLGKLKEVKRELDKL